MPEAGDDIANYGSPPWKTGAALRFLSLRRDFLQDC